MLFLVSEVVWDIFLGPCSILVEIDNMGVICGQVYEDPIVGGLKI